MRRVRADILRYSHETARARPLLPLQGRQQARGLYGNSGKKCPAKSLNGDYVERLVWADIEAFLRDPGDVVERLRERILMPDSERQQQEKKLNDLKARLQDKTAERDRVLALYRR